MSTLKSLAVPLGVTFGGGCVDRIHNLHFPTSFADADPGATIMRTEFSQIDLCPWPKDADGDLWTAPGVVDYGHTDEAYAWALAKGLVVSAADPAYTSPLLTWLFTSDGKGGWIATGGRTAAQLTTILHDYYTAWYARYPVDHSSVPNEMIPYDVAYPGGTSGSGGQYCIDAFYQLCDVGLAGGRSRAQFIGTICSWVKAASPTTKILMNQWGCEGADASGPAGSAPTHYRSWISGLLAAGVSFDGIGIQSHFNVPDATALNATGYRNTLTAYAALGLPVYITEFDINGAATGWAQAHHDLIKAALDAGVQYISVWTARDPLFYGANGALWTSGLVATAARASVEQALSEGTPATIAQGQALGTAIGSMTPGRKIEVMA